MNRPEFKPWEAKLKLLIAKCRDTILDHPAKCADCGSPIGQDKGPPDGWQLEDGRTVCQTCCVKDTKAMVQRC
jgi:hypothetical protein